LATNVEDHQGNHRLQIAYYKSDIENDDGGLPVIAPNVAIDRVNQPVLFVFLLVDL